MKNAAQIIAKRMGENFSHAAELGIKTTPNWFNDILEVTIESQSITFENANAKSFLIQAVIKQIDKEVYYSIFPEIRMDINGNYTKDSTKWA